MNYRRLAPWLALLTLTAAGTAAAAGYGLTAPKRYRATAHLIVAPVSPTDPTFAGIDVLRDTGGKRTAAASVAALLRAPQIVDAVRAQLALHRSRRALLGELDTHVVGDSDVVAVDVEDTSPAGAARLANTFAGAFVTQRTAAFQGQLANAIHRDEQLIAGGAGTTVKLRLVTLRSLQAQPDPTVRVAAQAATPSSPVWPSLPRLIGSGAGLGAAAGVLAGLALLLLRRPGVRRPAEYDRDVSDEALEQLVDRLESRLAARESALVARERDLQAKLDELRAAQAEATAAAGAGLTDREQQLAAREAELAERITKVTKREVELARRAARLAVRAREQEAQEQEARKPPPPPEPEPEPEPAAAPSPAPPAAPATAGRGNGTYNLTALERLVEERGAEFPDRVEEWTSYLFFLRDYAAADGSVPAGFDWLIQDTFRELVP